MSTETARLLGIVGQLLVGLAILLVVWLLGRDGAAPGRRAMTTGWFIVGVLGIAVVVLAAVRLPSAL